MDISDQDCEIVYKKGSAYINSDALSQINFNSDPLKEMLPTGTEIQFFTQHDKTKRKPNQ